MGRRRRSNKNTPSPTNRGDATTDVGDVGGGGHLHRIHGLQSERGKFLNGMLCVARTQNNNNSNNNSMERRMSCWVDGEHEMKAIKESNLTMLDTSKMITIRICLKNERLGDEDFDLRISREEDNNRETYFDMHPFESETVTFKFGGHYTTAIPSLMALRRGVGFIPDSISHVVVKCDDLTTCQTINHHAVGMQIVNPFETRLLNELKETAGITLYAKVAPVKPYHATAEDPRAKSGAGDRRMKAGKAGLFQIYPCPCGRDYTDTFEVRYTVGDCTETYVDIVRSTPWMIVNLFADTFSGQDPLPELKFPVNLAKCDPQRFWNGIIYLDRLMASFRGRSNYIANSSDSLNTEWGRLVDGSRKARRANETARRIFTPRIDWRYERVHSMASNQSIANSLATLAALTVPRLKHYYAGSDRLEEFKPQRDIKHELLPCHYDSELEESMLCLAAVRISTDEHMHGHLFDDPFENVLKTCCYVCPSTTNLRECEGCGRVVYCSKQCQKYDWKTHRNLCASKRDDPTIMS